MQKMRNYLLDLKKEKKKKARKKVIV